MFRKWWADRQEFIDVIAATWFAFCLSNTQAALWLEQFFAREFDIED